MTEIEVLKLMLIITGSAILGIANTRLNLPYIYSLTAGGAWGAFVAYCL